MPRIAFVTAIASLARDDDMPPLLDACARAGVDAEVRAWDDPTVSWTRYDLVVLRSPWDYHARLPEFLAWCARTDAASRLLNPLAVVRWNTDKHYLADLAAAGALAAHLTRPTLLAYAGSGPQPDKSSLQGPYQRLEQAIGARRAVARQLQNQGYEYLSDELPMWSLRAQRDINAMRHIKSDSAVDYRFDPKDVFLDW